MIKIKKILLILLKICISAVLIYITLEKIGASEFLTEMITASLFWVALGLFLFLISFTIGAVQWWLILGFTDVQIGFRKALSFYFIGLFFNNFLPSSMGGDVYRMIDIKRYSTDTSAAVSTVFLDRFTGFFVMSCMAICASPLLLLNDSFPSQMRIFLIILPFLWILALLFFFNKRFARLFTGIIERFLPERLFLRGRGIYNNIYIFRKNPALTLKILGISFCVQLCRITAIYMLALSLHITVTPLPFFAFIPIIAMAAAVPVTLGGSGVREALGVVLFSTVLEHAELAAVFLFMAYIAAIITSLPGGIIFALRTKKLKRETR